MGDGGGGKDGSEDGGVVVEVEEGGNQARKNITNIGIVKNNDLLRDHRLFRTEPQ